MRVASWPSCCASPATNTRIDTLLDQMQGLDTALAVPLALFRQLVRADQALAAVLR